MKNMLGVFLGKKKGKLEVWEAGKEQKKLERERVEKVDRSDLVNIKLQSICACIIILLIFFIVIDIIIVTSLIIIYVVSIIVINKIIKLQTWSLSQAE